MGYSGNDVLITSDLVLVNVGEDEIRPVVYFFDRAGDLLEAESLVDVGTIWRSMTTAACPPHRGASPGRTDDLDPRPGRGGDGIGPGRVGRTHGRSGALRHPRDRGGRRGRQRTHRGRPVPGPAAGGRDPHGGGHPQLGDGGRRRAVPVDEKRRGAGRKGDRAGANGQDARFIEELFTATDTTDFVGSVRCTVPHGESFTGVAVELDSGNGIFTTLPVVPIHPEASEDRETTLNFAHFANGTSGDGTLITSDLVLVNVAASTARPAIYFYDRSGELQEPESMVDISEDLLVRDDGGLTLRTPMARLGELTISTHGRGEVVTGSVRVVASGAMGGVLRFDIPGVGVAGVGASEPTADALFPARRKQGAIRTAAAIRNLEVARITVRCWLMSSGKELESVDINLGGNGQHAGFIEELFTRTDTRDFVGSVRCTAPGEGMFTGVAVELDTGNRIFTTLPVVPIQP